jgi:hypothetical protein
VTAVRFWNGVRTLGKSAREFTHKKAKPLCLPEITSALCISCMAGYRITPVLVFWTGLPLICVVELGAAHKLICVVELGAAQKLKMPSTSSGKSLFRLAGLSPSQGASS